MYIPKKILLTLLSCYCVSLFSLQAQTKQEFPLTISLMDESLILPGFKFLQYSFNPAIMIGTEYVLKENPKSDWFLTGNLGLYYHDQSQLGALLQSEFGYRRKMGKWNASLRVGAAYLHSFSTKPVYLLENGTVSEGTDVGNPTFMPSAALSVGYRVGDQKYSPELFLIWMNSMELPFDYYTGAHQFTGIGIKFYPFR